MVGFVFFLNMASFKSFLNHEKALSLYDNKREFMGNFKLPKATSVQGWARYWDPEKEKWGSWAPNRSDLGLLDEREHIARISAAKIFEKVFKRSGWIKARQRSNNRLLLLHSFVSRPCLFYVAINFLLCRYYTSCPILLPTRFAGGYSTPCIVVKELVENAIDAGATKLRCRLKILATFIQVTDNGKECRQPMPVWLSKACHFKNQGG